MSLDIFSYHNYNGVSERLASVMPSAHWSAEEALYEDYLAVASNFCKTYVPLREKYFPGAQMCVTESGDAGGGGNTWASTFLDVPCILNELGTFARLTDGVIFHNTLDSSDYAILHVKCLILVQTILLFYCGIVECAKKIFDSAIAIE